MLSRSDMTMFREGELSEIFLDKLFETTQTYHGMIDFYGYLDLMLAMEDIDSPQSVAYFFRIIDFGNLGYINEYAIEIFVSVKLIYFMIILGGPAKILRELQNGAPKFKGYYGIFILTA